MDYKTANKWYPVRLWLLSVGLLTPAIYFLFFSASDHTKSSVFESLWTAVKLGLFGLGFSFPVFIIFLVFWNFLIKKNLPLLLNKLLLCLFGIAGAILWIKTISGKWFFNLSIPYSLSIIISCIYLRLYEKSDTPDQPGIL
jgi:hypothetical protein